MTTAIEDLVSMKCTVSPSVLSSSLSLVSRAVSPRSTLPILSNVLLETAAGGLHLTATNLDLTISATVPAEVALEGRVTVPARHLAEVARAITPNRARVTITVSPQRNQIFFSLADVEISSRLIEGNYPNYAQVIPAESTTTVTLPATSLLRETRTAAVLAKDAANVVRFAAGPDTLTLSAQTAEVGDDEAPLTAAVNGEDVQIAFNARYVLDALAVLDAEEVQLAFNGPLSPGVLRPVGRDDYLYIVMPVRVPM